MITVLGIGLSSSPLLKIPLLLSTTAITVAGTSPPRPPASVAAKKKFEGRQDVLGGRIGRLSIHVYKIVYWLNAIGESVAILCTSFPVLERYGILWLTGCAMMITGALIRLACYRTLGRFFTWELTLQKDQHLVTTGPYSIVRHPAYAGSWLLSIGSVFMHLGPGGWLHECVSGNPLNNTLMAAWGILRVTVAVILTTRVNREDEVLRKEFGEEWKAWARRTPYKLIPFLYYRPLRVWAFDRIKRG